MTSRLAWLSALTLVSAARSAYADAPPAHLYVRADTPIATVAVQPEASPSVVARCVAPCEADLAPGRYRLALDGVRSDSTFEVRDTRTAKVRVESHLGSRAGGLLALNVGGILGATFIAIGSFGGPSWTYYVGGGTLLGSGGAFLLLYRSDRLEWSLTPGAPLDLDQSPAGAPAPRAALEPAVDRTGPRAAARSGLGLRLAF
ncbi:MAG TPA: hypothetical protein VGM29_14160 [Polyangiaceae bacterium]|jgi:hypothetical protein